jgi:hypothetical protein
MREGTRGQDIHAARQRYHPLGNWATYPIFRDAGRAGSFAPDYALARWFKRGLQDVLGALRCAQNAFDQVIHLLPVNGMDFFLHLRRLG